MRVGFTGTREGLKEPQLAALRAWMEQNRFSEFHHGCCCGADEKAAMKASEFDGVRVVGHPPVYEYALSRKSLLFNDECRQPLTYAERNLAIVVACDVLVACPKGMTEELRSGTWMTVRMGRRQGKRIVIVWPDGSITGTETARTPFKGNR